MNVLVIVNSKVKTGGPLALFQLASKLSCLKNLNVFVACPINSRSNFLDWAESFLGTSQKLIGFDQLQSTSWDIAIIPETNIPESIQVVSSAKLFMLYMLSVDNIDIFGIPPIGFIRSLQRMIIKIAKWKSFTSPSWRNFSPKISLILTQSEYSQWTVGNHMNAPFFYIGDYIDLPLSHSFSRFDCNTRRIRLCTNGAKGVVWAKLARLLNPSVVIDPISGITRENLPTFIRGYDAYIDFGGHPGKDRLPREALASGVPVFLFRRGAGINATDYGIRSEFKLELSDIFWLDKRLRKALSSITSSDVATWQATLSMEEERFTQSVRALFLSLASSQSNDSPF